MNSFVGRFAEVARIPEPQLHNEDLNACLVACKRFLESLCAEKGISLELNLCKENPFVMLDAALFEQVMVNIIKNSVESITGEDGKIVITTSVNCGTVSVDVSVNGCGIPTDVAQQLFSPFFTTKPQGQGLGLTLIREILTKHNCTFQLHTEDDGITHFLVKFIL